MAAPGTTTTTTTNNMITKISTRCLTCLPSLSPLLVSPPGFKAQVARDLAFHAIQLPLYEVDYSDGKVDYDDRNVGSDDGKVDARISDFVSCLSALRYLIAIVLYCMCLFSFNSHCIVLYVSFFIE